MKKFTTSRREILAMLGAAALRAQDAHLMVYIGTYTHGKSKGIYLAHYAEGKLSGMELAAETESPSFLALHPNRRFLYAVNELNAGTVSAFAIENGGKLKFLNRVSSHGAAPCHLDVDKTGKCLCVANYSSGNVAVFPVHADGSLGEASDLDQHHGSSVDKQRQSSPHAHESVISKDNRFLFVPDLGLDQVVIYNLDPARGRISDRRSVKVQAGSGPRHIAFHPNGRYAYVVSEMGGLITAFHYQAANGALETFQTISTLPKDYQGFHGAAEIEIHPNGHFLYASNRGPDTLALFHIAAGGGLTEISQTPTQGKTPRHFAIDPAGKFLLVENQDSDNIVSFAIDPGKGTLTPTGQITECGAPVCILYY
ncbi:MAG TPA: lactonase family protein [Bryobacteraceae bacterium]|nr:lactonase family protein [Bryobacteraceae bacterium]